MKKNKMMRLASVLLVLVMLTTCVISGTFAKYVTADDAHDVARVAKWGIEITATDDGDSKTVYEASDPTATEGHISTNQTLKLLAPGTSGQLVDITISGKPEVAYDVTVAVDLELTGWEAKSAVYCPVVFTVTANGTATKYMIDLTNTDTEKLEEAIEQAIIDALLETSSAPNATPENYGGTDGTIYACQYAADDDFYETAKTVKVEWAWAFEQGNTAEEKADFNELDTILGDAGTAQIKFDFAVQVTQVD